MSHEVDMHDDISLRLCHMCSINLPPTMHANCHKRACVGLVGAPLPPKDA